jgi:nicotinate-nucleotide pyrophosphorylase
MPPEQIKEAAGAVKETDERLIVEASGGITQENIGEYLDAGADYVSTSLFVSAKPCKFKLEIV